MGFGGFAIALVCFWILLW